jgi:hypothetical protein
MWSPSGLWLDDQKYIDVVVFKVDSTWTGRSPSGLWWSPPGVQPECVEECKVLGRGMEKGRGCIGKGDGDGEGMYREGGWKREEDGHCSHRAGVDSSRGGGLITRGWTRRAGEYWLRGGGLVVWAWTCHTGVTWPSWLPFVHWRHLVRQGGQDEGGTGGAHLCIIL